MPAQYQFQFSHKSEKDFEALPRQAQKHIIQKLEYLEKSSDPLNSAKKLQGTKNKFRFRIGTYRVIAAKKNKKTIIILVILKIAHRKNAYN